jgi:hypothetical protein
MIAEHAQGWDRLEKRLDLGSERSGFQQKKSVSLQRLLQPPLSQADLSSPLLFPPNRPLLHQRAPRISNPHHLTIVTFQNPSGYHPDVRRVHFAEQGNDAALPPTPRLPLRMVRLYRL